MAAFFRLTQASLDANNWNWTNWTHLKNAEIWRIKLTASLSMTKADNEWTTTEEIDADARPFDFSSSAARRKRCAFLLL
jgi:hypothetical protein